MKRGTASKKVDARKDAATDQHDPDELLTLNEVFALLKIGRTAWYSNKIYEEPEFTACFIGKRPRYRRRDVVAYMIRMRSGQ